MKLSRFKDFTINEASKPAKYTVTASTKKSIDRSVKDGYDELTDFLSGKMELKKFLEFVSNMSMSEIESDSEQRTFNRLEDAVTELMEDLKKTKQITDQEAKDFDSAISELSSTPGNRRGKF